MNLGSIGGMVALAEQNQTGSSYQGGTVNNAFLNLQNKYTKKYYSQLFS